VFGDAAAAYEKMRDAAKKDGVTLRIVDSFRSRGRAKANAAGAGNANAVANYFSHTMGWPSTWR
jgi:LAS superfamily LD-carboxypeptidase LdcB